MTASEADHSARVCQCESDTVVPATPVPSLRRGCASFSDGPIVPFQRSPGSGSQLAATPTTSLKRSYSDMSAGAIVPFEGTPTSGSRRKPQRTLASFWSLPGPQLSVHRSPDTLVKSEQWLQEQQVREQLARERAAKLPGEWLQPKQIVPHSGGSRGGRPVAGPVRGTAAGEKRDVRPLGAAVLRRDPSLAEKLAVIHKVKEAGKDPAAIPSHVRTEIQKFSGYNWPTIMQWRRRTEEFSAQFCKLK